MNSLIRSIFAKSSQMIDAAVKSMHETINSIDFDEVDKEVKNTFASVKTRVNPLIEKVKTLAAKHVVEFPYDNETSKLSFKIENNVLTVNVSSFDGTVNNTHSMTIPENVDVNNIHQTYDANRKMIVFKFGMKSEVTE